MKPQLSENEINELTDLLSIHSYAHAVSDVMIFLKKKYGWSDVHSVICDIRIEIQNKAIGEKWDKFSEKHPNETSTLSATLGERMDYEAAQAAVPKSDNQV